MSLWVALVALGAGGPGRAQPVAPPETKPTIEQVLKTWRTRQGKVQSTRFELKFEQTIHKGSLSLDDDVRMRLGENAPVDAEPNPPRDYNVTGTGGIAVSGTKLRYWYDGQQWDPVARVLYPERFLDTYDGKLYKYLVTPASGRHDYPMAGVKKATESQSATQFVLSPLFLTVRGDHAQFYQDLGKFEVTDRVVLLAGNRPCRELVRTSPKTDQREVIYLDQQRDHVVVRKVMLVDGQPTWQLDVSSYAPDPTVGWVPKSWEYVIRTSAKKPPEQSGRYEVVRYEINPAIDDGDFDIAFPPRTRVLDTSAGQEVQYVIRENGEKGREVPTAANPTYQDLEKAAARLNRSLLLAVWGTIFVLAVGGWLWLRYRRKKRAGVAPPAA